MLFNKTKIVEKFEGNKLIAVMTTVLVVLLLISQLSLASGNINSRFFLDAGFGSLQVDEPESNAINVSTPDIIHIVSEHILPLVYHRCSYEASIKFFKNNYQNYSIRSPPSIF